MSYWKSKDANIARLERNRRADLLNQVAAPALFAAAGTRATTEPNWYVAFSFLAVGVCFIIYCVGKAKSDHPSRDLRSLNSVQQAHRIEVNHTFFSLSQGVREYWLFVLAWLTLSGAGLWHAVAS